LRSFEEPKSILAMASMRNLNYEFRISLK
jgi:hypothetical protein